ncbi:protein arginine N-methyltransferase 1-like [Portunus trituberculatus]|uniref:type I protein arginine methyltransferase n=1 Tax=Portunus trituberculatus TaxID=210409 RepID=A0A5B7DGS7_PORTR|nr:protein arginine N-methyltransferase 1-like [Portunus trituberculatus]XP_045132179.1 protein arginine N-methyltransferase 1-like [Portunus trituberculatus]MPC20295.1 Protein arginine N-methyltransferase 3 [Portunus trituberculatus]
MSKSDDEMPPLEDDPTPVHHLTPSSTQARCAAHSTPPATNTSATNIDSESSDDDEWLEMEEEGEEEKTCATCLFCEATEKNSTALLAHMLDSHGFDLVQFVCNARLDQVAYIKLVNYVRATKPSPEELMVLKGTPWDEATHLTPVLKDDLLLMFDVEGLPGRQDEVEEDMGRSCEGASREELTRIVLRQREVLQRLLQAAACLADEKKQEGWQRTVADRRPEEDEGYFNSYAHFDIHHEMLSDRVRTEAYRDAILGNTELLKGKRVLDLGCGTGILSLFSAKAGATVTAVDMSDVIYQAMEIARENKMDKAITFSKGRLEDLELPTKYHCIVSEWMGYFLLFEGMLDSVLYARDHHLMPGGILMPNRCSLHLLGIEDLESHKKLITFWDDVYGFKMSCLRREVVKEASTDVVKEHCVLTSAAQIAEFNLMTAQPSDTEFSCQFSLTAKRDGQMTGFAGYFDAHFDLPCPVTLPTGPNSTPTHWKQTIFYLPHPQSVTKGELLSGHVSVRRKRREVRSLEVTITWGDQTFRYLVE